MLAAINPVVDAVQKLVGLIEKAISLAGKIPGVPGGFGMPDITPGFNPSDIPIIGGSLPFTAAGGIVTRPTVLVAGEGSESEAIIPLSKLPGILGGGPVGGGAQSVEIVLQLDGEDIARKTVQLIQGAGGNIDGLEAV